MGGIPASSFAQAWQHWGPVRKCQQESSLRNSPRVHAGRVYLAAMTFLVEQGLRCQQGLCERGSVQEQPLDEPPALPQPGLLWAPALGSLT